MIEITPTISIDEKEIQLEFIRSSGPGGQNVNKVSTGVQLRFNVTASYSLPDEVKQRLHGIARNRISEDGTLIIEAKRYRTQKQNREDAIARLAALIYRATERPKPRRRTKPTHSSQEERIGEKKRRGALKRSRRYTPADLE